MLKGVVETGQGEERAREGDLVRACLAGSLDMLPRCPALRCLTALSSVQAEHPHLARATINNPPQVFIHYSLSDASGDVLLSTRAEHGGAGRPQPFVLGRGRRMLRGMELGVMGALGGGAALSMLVKHCM